MVTAFVYVQIYVKDANASTLVMLDNNGNPVNILTGSAVDGGYTYNLVESVVGSNYGRYYLDGNKTYGYIDIWAPELVLKAELANNPGTSVDGKTVTKNTEITFSLQAPHVGPASGTATQNISAAFDNIDDVLEIASSPVNGVNYTYINNNVSYINANLTAVITGAEKLSIPAEEKKPTTDDIASSVELYKKYLDDYVAENPSNVKYLDDLYPVVHLIFTTPAGGKTTYFGDKNYAATFLSKNVETVVGTSNAGDDAQAGLYTVQAEYIAPTLFDRYAKESNTVTHLPCRVQL